MSFIRHRQIASRRSVALAIGMIVLFGSIGAAVYFATSNNNDSEIELMSIGVQIINSNYIQVFAIFNPFDENLRLRAIRCSPFVSNINPIHDGTNESAYDTWFNATLTLDIYGDFVVGTAYQFTFEFLDEYGKVKTVYLATEFIPSNESVQINRDTAMNEFMLASESFGDQQIFWTPLSLPESAELSQLRATLLSVGSYCYVYVANTSIELLGEETAITKCDELKQIFDDVIYPKAVELAGHPDGYLGDIDGDPKLTLFLAPLVRNMGSAYLGFHNSRDEFPGPYSNEREMIYLDAEKNLNETVCITIHEFNHMIWDNYEIDEADFLMEGLANFAIDYTGYWYYITDAVTTTFTYHPEVSLLHFNRFYSQYWDASYGQAYLFVTYLAERFGIDTVKSLVTISEDGPVAVEIALASAGYEVSFNEVYLDFITACVLDMSGIENGVYGFESANYTTQRYTILGNNYPIIKEDITHYHYGFHVNRLAAPVDNLTIEIENPYPYALGIVVAIRDDNGWSVTQSLRYSTVGEFTEYISGMSVEEVYVITSLMSQETPTDYEDVFALSEIPSENLDLSIMEGIIESLSGFDRFYLPITGLIILVFCSAIIIYRKRKSKYNP